MAGIQVIRQGDRYGSWAVVGRFEDSKAYVCRNLQSGARGLLYTADPGAGMPLETVRSIAEILTELDHPVTLKIQDANSQQGWFVTELAAGDNLQTKLEGSVVDLTDALRMAREVADCLDQAHHKGIHHWQINPGRIVFWQDQIKLLDFSAVQQAPQVSEFPPASHFPYLPPELHKKSGADPVQWDLYALGVTLYESLTGERAHISSDQMDEVPVWMVRDKLRRPFLDPGPAFPKPVRRLVKQATSVKPSTRFSSAAAFRDAVIKAERALEPGDGAFSARVQVMLRAVLALVLLTVVGGLGVMFAGMDAEQLMGTPTRSVRLIVNGDDPRALNQVTVNGMKPDRAVGTSFYFLAVAVGTADILVTSGKGCGPPYCPGELCPFCCTGARVTRTIEAGAGEMNLVIPLSRNSDDEPRPVLITAPDLPGGVRLEAYLYSDDGNPKGVRVPEKRGWRFGEVAPGSYEMLVEAGKCSRAALGCFPDGLCPKGCTSLLDVLLVPCGTGDLEIAVDIPAPL
jgi:hypothetical protein